MEHLFGAAGGFNLCIAGLNIEYRRQIATLKLGVLDEVLGLVDNGIITVDELKQVLDLKSEDQDIIMTGNTVTESLCDLADEITTITTRYNEGR